MRASIGSHDSAFVGGVKTCTETLVPPGLSRRSDVSFRILFAVHGPADPRTAVYSDACHRRADLQAAGHTVDILSPEDLRLRWIPARLDPLTLPISLACRDLRTYDIVIFHSYLGWAFHAARRWLDGARRAATTTMFHGLEPLYHRAVADELARHGSRVSTRFRMLHHVIVPWLLRSTVSRSDAVFCLNRSEADYLTTHQWAEPQRIHVVANGFDQDASVDLRDYAAGRRFLCIAQWLPAKGNRYLADAFTILARRCPDVELTCAGTGADAETVLRAFPADVQPRVRVLPRLERQGIRDALRTADAFVFPSLSEGSSLALLEALGARLPVVCTPAGAAADILLDGVDALVVPMADTAALAAAMERIRGDEPLRRRLGAAGAAVAERHHWTIVGQHYHELLHEIVAGHAAL